MRETETNGNRVVTCDDCFFRRAELCALPGNTPCPTFRPAKQATLARSVQAQLVERPKSPAYAAAAA